jgi:hypothetical protein
VPPTLAGTVSGHLIPGNRDILRRGGRTGKIKNKRNYAMGKEINERNQTKNKLKFLKRIKDGKEDDKNNKEEEWLR